MEVLDINLPKVHWFNILEDHDCLWMFFNHLPPTQVGLAKSVDGVNFKVVRESVLTKGPRFLNRFGPWDSVLIESHSVIRNAGKWRMYFGGYDGHWRIGYAESKDLENWTKYWDNPVFDLGQNGWEAKHVADPHLIDFNGKRLMYYMGKGDVWQVGLAVEDGSRFTRHKKNPVIKAEKDWNNGCVCLSGIICVADQLLGAVHGYNPDDGKFRAYMMKSEDAVNWTESRFLGENIIHPEIHAFKGELVLYYTDSENNFGRRYL